ncbi:MAG: glycosyltransferase [Lachnospiraceae bacterium]|nr:glycosyltransferase [Lachnospiraceae bacterium]
MPKVSIVVPVYNVEKYLRQCMDSIVNQTLKDIEIICVDDGSTDSSGAILDEYASKDSRVRVIHKKNSGYGNSMNIGFDAANGEYIGIVESDDYAEADMFEKLYAEASKNQLDVVKSSFYFYYSIPKEKNEKCEIVSKILAKQVFCPTTYFDSKMEMVELFNIKPSIWSAIYRREFIRENKIRFLETPGASYQDSSFNFKVWSLAKRAELLQDAFLHYRQDGENSSINSKGKVFCVCDEYAEMQRFLDKNPLLKSKMEFIMQRIKFDSYMWNYGRLAQKYKYIFLERASEEFKEGLLNGSIDKEYFEWYKWNDLNEIADDPALFHTEREMEKIQNKNNFWKQEYERVKGSLTYKIGNCITIGPRVIRRFIRCIGKHGIRYTFTTSLSEVKGGKRIG